MDKKVLEEHFFHPAPSTLFTAVLFSASTICFVFSLDHTQVTSTLVLTNTAPLITAILAFIFLKEKLSVSTIVTIIISVGGIWLVFGYKPTGAELEGDSLALVTAVSLSVYLIMLRKTKARYGTVFLIYSGYLVAVIALLAGAKPFSLSFQQNIYIFLLCCIVLPGSFLLINIGPRYLPAAEASLILLLEVLFGPLLVWLFIGEKQQNPSPLVLASWYWRWRDTRCGHSGTNTNRINLFSSALRRNAATYRAADHYLSARRKAHWRARHCQRAGALRAHRHSRVSLS